MPHSPYICTMKYIYVAIGSISLVLGVIGIFLPILPTTPFLLLSAALFFRGSPRLYTWLLEHKYLGPYIRSFREDRAIPLRAKIISVSLLWITAIHCVLFFISVLVAQRNNGRSDYRCYYLYFVF